MREGIICLVPDNAFWVTNRIAIEIRAEMQGCNVRSIICSELILQELLLSGRLPIDGLRLVHFLTPHSATRFRRHFEGACPLVATIHHIEDDRSTEPLTFADSIMTVSREWDTALRQLGVPAPSLHLVPNGVNIQLFCPRWSSEREQIRRILGIDERAFVVGFSCKATSNSYGRKGIELFAGIVEEMDARNIDVVWLLRGPGWRDWVKEMTGSGKRIRYIEFAINDRDLAASYAAMDAYMITSRIEGGPVPLLEAMASGLPVITTRVGMVSDVVKDKENAFIVEDASVGGFVARLSLLHGDQLCRERVGQSARRTIESSWQWRHTIKGVHLLYTAAETSFAERREKKNSDGMGMSEKIDFNLPSFVRWVEGREHIRFAEYLFGAGAVKEAAQFSRIAIIKSRFDFRVFASSIILWLKILKRSLKNKGVYSLRRL